MMTNQRIVIGCVMLIVSSSHTVSRPLIFDRVCTYQDISVKPNKDIKEPCASRVIDGTKNFTEEYILGDHKFRIERTLEKGSSARVKINGKPGSLEPGAKDEFSVKTDDLNVEFNVLGMKELPKGKKQPFEGAWAANLKRDCSKSMGEYPGDTISIKGATYIMGESRCRIYQFGESTQSDGTYFLLMNCDMEGDKARRVGTIAIGKNKNEAQFGATELRYRCPRTH